MTQDHKGHTQPAIDREEHSEISNTPGKKVFVIDNADNQVIQFTPTKDDVSDAAMTADFSHHEIHEGDRYLVQEGIQLNDASKEYLIVTPDTTKWAHMVIVVVGSQDTSLKLVEGTGKTAGTAMVEINRNRNSSNTAGVVITHTPGGTEGSVATMFTCQFGVAQSAGGRGGAGAMVGGRAELVLKQNTSYSLTVTALSANANNICVEIDWYEHTSVA